ncbi:CDP-alcohol phosphatidyltransferase [Streptomyces prasinopilosus]|uniref:CDP-alcohol phosphatidyltransferase n=1 Tax=Streptomyces prasinopilosus TaxID=67344 RepID=UPI000AAD5DE0
MPVFTRLRRPARTTAPPRTAAPARTAGENPRGQGHPSPPRGEEPAEPRGEGEAAPEKPVLRAFRLLRSLRTRCARLRDEHPRAARAVRWTLHGLAAVLVLGALLLPNQAGALRPGRFTRIPAEAIVGAVLLLALPRRPRIAAAALYGTGLAVLTVLNVLDIGFNEYLGRSFNVVLDWGLLDDARHYVEDSMGGAAATAAGAGAVLLALLLVVVMALAAVRLGELLARHRARAARGALVAGTVWITCTALGLQVAGVPVASDRAAAALKTQGERVRDTLRDEAAFERVARTDPFAGTPSDRLLPGLRGKDVLITFIESYGRTALEDPVIAPGVTGTLDAATGSLAGAGFTARSGWLTSSTFGGSSWLGHSTALSGLWIDNQQRYRTATASDRLTLTEAFGRTGAWDTVGVMPGVQKGWPEAEWYGLDTVYDAFGMGYRGPKFSWSTMPDQYALEAFQRLEHGRRRDGGKNLMAEIILTSSHQPWAPVPEMVGWDELGDGSVFGPIRRAGRQPGDIMADTTESRREYGRSVEYSVTALTQWLERYGSDDTVLVFLGDHQPIARVSGVRASRDVPVTVVARDPEVLEQIADWNWTEGLRPDRDAPVWRMDAFRDRFLKAYGSVPHPAGD